MAQRDEKGRFVRTKPDYKAMYDANVKAFKKVIDNWTEAEKQRDFLLQHAPFLLRWMYNRKFKE